jgi:chromosome segregation ATPase
MNEGQTGAPEQVRKFAPKRKSRNEDKSRIDNNPMDEAGEALIVMLHEAARLSDDNRRRLTSLVDELSRQMQAAEDRITELEQELEHFRARAARAEEWLLVIEKEIEQRLMGPMTAMRREPIPLQ